MRQALVQAIHHARHRRAFGKRLIDQPLMRNVLADLALESEAAVALSLRVARAIDASGRDANEAAFARITTAIGTYFVCKRCVPFVNEAQECLGGAGYVEESILARLYRQVPLNSIWEGSGNIQCLDLLRALVREPDTRPALFAELDAARRTRVARRRAPAFASGARSQRCAGGAFALSRRANGARAPGVSAPARRELRGGRPVLRIAAWGLHAAFALAPCPRTPRSTQS